MPPLRKPHRVAVLLPQLHVDGPDAAYQRETSLLVWIACIEACQRHPGLAVYEPESMPLQPMDGHFVPSHGRLGAAPDDAHYGSTRRDEVVWLEVTLIPGKSSEVKLHALARGGKRQSFAALGRKVGDQIEQVFVSWLAARGLGALPRGFEAVSTDDVLAVVRVFAPTMVEQARAWAQPVAPTPLLDHELELDDGDHEAPPPPPEIDEDTTGLKRVVHRPLGRMVANRLPPALRVPALRLLELAFREDLGELILAVDPDHPKAIFSRYLATRDPKLLRRAIAAAPGWAWPYAELASSDATALEIVAGAGIAAICRPGQLDVIETAADRLADNGRIDEALRLIERAAALHDRDPRAHAALLELHRRTGRRGAWHRQAHRSALRHGCPLEKPWYPDQLQIDLLVSDALNGVGRLADAIALRASRLEGREAAWPRATRVLANWRTQPRFVAWAYAREGAYRGDDARTVEGFGRAEPADEIDLACFLDALVALGREDEVALAWAQFGLGGGCDGPVARLAAARTLLAAGEWRRGVEELWRVELMQPGRDDHVAIARCAMLLCAAPLEILEHAIGERVAIGAATLARRMSRDVADFVPGAAKSSVISRALGKMTAIDFDPAWLAGFAPETRSRRAIDELFAQLGGLHDADGLARGDRLVNRWLEVLFAEAAEDDEAGLAQAAAYTAAHALGRYLAATTAAPSVVAGALRTVAGEALALVREHRAALGDREARALFAVLDPLLRRVDRWIGGAWLATVERCCGIDERSDGDVTGFARELATVAARVLGPEEVAVLAASVARLHAERPDGWAAAVAVQAPRLMTHTGRAGIDEWADAIVAQLADRTIESDDAIDALYTACYLADGVTAGPAIHLTRMLLRAGRAPAALAVLTGGLRAAPDHAWRDRALASLADDWKTANLDVSLEFARLAADMFEALQQNDAARAEKLGRFAVAFDPSNAEAHRNLGLALAQQGKTIEAMQHLVRGTRDQAAQLLANVLYQSGKLPAAMAVLDYASRWYVRADQWLTYGGIAFAALDNPRTVKAYAIAYQLDPAAFDASQLNAYAGVLDDIGDYTTCEAIAKLLLAAAGGDLMWQTNAWNHLACACVGQGRFTEAVTLAERAVAQNPVTANAAGFAMTLERARGRTQKTPAASTIPRRESIFAQLEAGDHAAAMAQLDDVSWRVRRAALGATRFRVASHVAVPLRARSAALAMLAETTGVTAREELACRALALQIREQAYFARDPLPHLGERMTRDAFLHELRARGGSVIGEPEPAAPAFVDRVVVAGAKVARASDMVALLRDLAALTPTEALAQFDLDDAGYLEVAKAWGAAIEQDPSIAALVDAGLAKR